MGARARPSEPCAGPSGIGRSNRVGAVVIAAALASAAPTSADQVAAPPGTWPVADAEVAATMLARLEGQRARWGDGVLTIDDVAGAGRPWIGVVERAGDALWLVGAHGRLRLTGPLARPRLAGPGYVIWIIGAQAGDRVAVRRLGVLAPPAR